MPPLPKDPSTRQRTNKATSAKVFTVSDNEDIEIPVLPSLVEFWHPQAVDHWRDFWASPMRGEFLDVDRDAILAYFVLVNRYWFMLTSEDSRPNDLLKLAAELRQVRMAFGLTPMDRRRLQWQVEQTKSAQRRSGAVPVSPTTSQEAVSDPRLKLVQ